MLKQELLAAEACVSPAAPGSTGQDQQGGPAAGKPSPADGTHSLEEPKVERIRLSEHSWVDVFKAPQELAPAPVGPFAAAAAAARRAPMPAAAPASAPTVPALGAIAAGPATAPSNPAAAAAAAAEASSLDPPLPVPRLPADFEQLWALHPAEPGTVRLFGKEQRIPRYQQSYGRAYTFSGQTLFGGDVPPVLQPYLNWANSLPQYGQRFNEILLNWYEDGNHYIGKHADDERQLVPHEPIISLSLGATRTFRIRDLKGSGGRGGSDVRRDIEMRHGTCLVMGGRMQKEFTHEVPQISGQKGKIVGRRINITMRAFKPEDGTTAGRAAGSVEPVAKMFRMALKVQRKPP